MVSCVAFQVDLDNRRPLWVPGGPHFRLKGYRPQLHPFLPGPASLFVSLAPTTSPAVHLLRVLCT